MAALRWRRRLAFVRTTLATPGDGRRAIAVLAWALVLPLLKKVMPLRSLVRLMWQAPGRAAARDARREARLIALVGRLYQPGRLGARTNCLERSLILYRGLAEAQAEPQLVVGIERGAARFRGHAWVVVDGQPVGETWADLRAYTPLVTFGAEGRVVPSNYEL